MSKFDFLNTLIDETEKVKEKTKSIDDATSLFSKQLFAPSVVPSIPSVELAKTLQPEPEKPEWTGPVISVGEDKDSPATTPAYKDAEREMRGEVEYPEPVAERSLARVVWNSITGFKEREALMAELDNPEWTKFFIESMKHYGKDIDAVAKKYMTPLLRRQLAEGKEVDLTPVAYDRVLESFTKSAEIKGFVEKIGEDFRGQMAEAIGNPLAPTSFAPTNEFAQQLDEKNSFQNKYYAQKAAMLSDKDIQAKFEEMLVGYVKSRGNILRALETIQGQGSVAEKMAQAKAKDVEDKIKQIEELPPYLKELYDKSPEGIKIGDSDVPVKKESLEKELAALKSFKAPVSPEALAGRDAELKYDIQRLSDKARENFIPYVDSLDNELTQLANRYAQETEVFKLSLQQAVDNGEVPFEAATKSFQDMQATKQAEFDKALENRNKVVGQRILEVDKAINDYYDEAKERMYKDVSEEVTVPYSLVRDVMELNQVQDMQDRWTYYNEIRNRGPISGRYATANIAFDRGVSHMLGSIGGMAMMMGWHEWYRALRDDADAVEARYPFPTGDVGGHEFTLDNLLDWDWITMKAVENSPMTLALAGIGLGVGLATRNVALAKGASSTFAGLASATTATLFSRSAEIALEAGDAFNEIFEATGNIEMAKAGAKKVAIDNTYVALSDFAQFGAIFIPKVHPLLAMFTTMSTEALEEWWQEYSQARTLDAALVAQGKKAIEDAVTSKGKWTADPRSHEAMTLGAVMGLVFGGVGSATTKTIDYLSNRDYQAWREKGIGLSILDRLTADNTKNYNTRVKELNSVLDNFEGLGLISEEDVANAREMITRIKDLVETSPQLKDNSRAQLVDLSIQLANIEEAIPNTTDSFVLSQLKEQQSGILQEMADVVAGIAPGYFINDIPLSKNQFISVYQNAVNNGIKNFAIKNDSETYNLINDYVNGMIAANQIKPGSVEINVSDSQEAKGQAVSEGAYNENIAQSQYKVALKDLYRYVTQEEENGRTEEDIKNDPQYQEMTDAIDRAGYLLEEAKQKRQEAIDAGTETETGINRPEPLKVGPKKGDVKSRIKPKSVIAAQDDKGEQRVYAPTSKADIIEILSYETDWKSDKIKNIASVYDRMAQNLARNNDVSLKEGYKMLPEMDFTYETYEEYQSGKKPKASVAPKPKGDVVQSPESAEKLSQSEFERGEETKLPQPKTSKQEVATKESPTGKGKVAPKKTKARGMFVANPDVRNTLYLFKSADATTFLHEGSHGWLEAVLGDAAQKKGYALERVDNILSEYNKRVAKATPYMESIAEAKDKQTIQDIKAKAEADIRMTTKELDRYLLTYKGKGVSAAPVKMQDLQSNPDIYRNVHEFYAEGFEAWLMSEGQKTNNRALQKVFESIRDWFVSIYQHVLNSGNMPVGSISPEMEVIYSKMLNIKPSDMSVGNGHSNHVIMNSRLAFNDIFGKELYENDVMQDMLPEGVTQEDPYYINTDWSLFQVETVFGEDSKVQVGERDAGKKAYYKHIPIVANRIRAERVADALWNNNYNKETYFDSKAIDELGGYNDLIHISIDENTVTYREGVVEQTIEGLSVGNSTISFNDKIDLLKNQVHTILSTAGLKVGSVDYKYKGKNRGVLEAKAVVPKDFNIYTDIARTNQALIDAQAYNLSSAVNMKINGEMPLDIYAATGYRVDSDGRWSYNPTTYGMVADIEAIKSAKGSVLLESLVTNKTSVKKSPFLSDTEVSVDPAMFENISKEEANLVLASLVQKALIEGYSIGKGLYDVSTVADLISVDETLRSTGVAPMDVVNSVPAGGYVAMGYGSRLADVPLLQSVWRGAEERTMFQDGQGMPETINIDGIERPTTNNKGNLIHPTKEGIQNFWKWFGDSKVVDEQGRPLEVYHGQPYRYEYKDGDVIAVEPKKIDVFNNENPRFLRKDNKGFYFSDKRTAEDYAEGGNVYAVYLSSLNPFTWNHSSKETFITITKNKNVVPNFLTETDVLRLKDAGYDGVITESIFGKKEQFIVFESNQIKSTTENIGTFSKQDNNILFQEAVFDNLIDLSGRKGVFGEKSQVSSVIADFKSGKKLYGETFLPDGRVFNPSTEGMPDVVTMYSEYVSLDELTEARVLDVAKKQGFLYKNNPFAKTGIFEMQKGPNKGKWSIDVNVSVDKKYRENTLAFARKNNQESIWSYEIDDTIDTGGTGDPVLIAPEQVVSAGAMLIQGKEYFDSITNLIPANWDLDVAENGDYLFYHYSPEANLDFIDPKYFQKNRYTSDNRGVNVSFYYTKQGQRERMVRGDVNVVRVPRNRVYPFNTDPLNLHDIAYKNFRKENPYITFGPVQQIDYMNRLLSDNGYDMMVAVWNGGLRGETTKALAVDKDVTDRVRKGIPLLQSEIGFYSTVEDALTKITQPKGTPEQFKKMLLNNGAKQAEMDWMGFDEFIKGKQSVTKAEVQEWIDQNRIEVKEVVLEDKEGLKTVYEILDSNGEVYDSGVDSESVAMRISEEIGGTYVERQVETSYGAGTPTKHSQHQEPGGKNYREVLLTMPTKSNIPEGNYIAYLDKGLNQKREYLKGFNSATEARKWVEDNEGKYEYTLDYESKKAVYEIEERDSNFHSSHFDEPNILAHIRANDRTDSNGRRVLFLEEIQSDWAQTIKKHNGVNQYTDYSEGFKQEKKMPAMPFQKTDQWVNLSLRRMMRYAAENGYDAIAWTSGEMQFNRWGSERIDWIKDEDDSGNPMWNITVNEQQGGNVFEGVDLESRSLKERGLYINSKEQLKEVLKRNLSRERNDVEITKLTDRIWERMQKEDRGTSLPRKEGMESFYDVIVPAAANKLGKPFGAKVESVEHITKDNNSIYNDYTSKIDHIKRNSQRQEEIIRDISNASKDESKKLTDEYNFLSDSSRKLSRDVKDIERRVSPDLLKPRINETTTVQSLPITESMRQSVMEKGVPLFQSEAVISKHNLQDKVIGTRPDGTPMFDVLSNSPFIERDMYGHYAGVILPDGKVMLSKSYKDRNVIFSPYDIYDQTTDPLGIIRNSVNNDMLSEGADAVIRGIESSISDLKALGFKGHITTSDNANIVVTMYAPAQSVPHVYTGDRLLMQEGIEDDVLSEDEQRAMSEQIRAMSEALRTSYAGDVIANRATKKDAQKFIELSPDARLLTIKPVRDGDKKIVSYNVTKKNMDKVFTSIDTVKKFIENNSQLISKVGEEFAGRLRASVAYLNSFRHIGKILEDVSGSLDGDVSNHLRMTLNNFQRQQSLVGTENKWGPRFREYIEFVMQQSVSHPRRRVITEALDVLQRAFDLAVKNAIDKKIYDIKNVFEKQAFRVEIKEISNGIAEVKKLLDDKTINKIANESTLNMLVDIKNRLFGGKASVYIEIGELERLLRKTEDPKAADRIRTQLDLLYNSLDSGIYDTRQDANRKIVDVYETAERENRPLTDDEYFDTYLLGFTDIYSMNSIEIKNTIKEIKAIAKNGRAYLKAKREAKANELAAFKIDALGAIIGQKIEKDEAGNYIDQWAEVVKERKATLETKINRSWLRQYNLGHLNFYHLLDRITLKSKDRVLQNPWVREMMRKSLRSEETMIRNIQEMEVYIRQKAREIFGVKSGSERDFVAIFGYMKEEFDFNYTYSDGTPMTVKLTLGQAYKKWMELQSESLAATFAVDNKISENFQQEIVNFIEKHDTPDKKTGGHVLDWARWQLDEFYSKYPYQNAVGKDNGSLWDVYADMYGTGMPMNDRYSPIYRREAGEITDKGDKFLSGASSHVATAKTRYIVERTNSKKRLRFVDGNDVLFDYLYKIEFFKSWSHTLKTYNSVFSDEGIRDAIRMNYGLEYYEAINEAILDMSSASSRLKQRDSIIDYLRSASILSVLAVNVPVWFKQLTSVPAYLAFAGMNSNENMAVITARYFKNLASSIGGLVPLSGTLVPSIRKINETLMEAPYLQERYKGGVDVNEILALKRKSTGEKLLGLSNWRDKMMAVMKDGDRRAIFVGGWPIYKMYYDQAIKDGKTPEEAKAIGLEEFVMATRASQQSGTSVDLSRYQKANSFYQAMMMYSTSSLGYHRMAMASLRRLARGQGGAFEASSVILSHMLLPAIFQFVANGFRWDDEDQLRAAVLGNLNYLFILGNLLEVAAMVGVHQFFGSGSGLTKNDEVNVTPLMVILSHYDKLWKQAPDIVSDWAGGLNVPASVWVDVSMEFYRLLAHTTAIPQIPGRFGQNLYALATEEFSLGDKVRLGVGFSKYSIGVFDETLYLRDIVEKKKRVSFYKSQNIDVAASDFDKIMRDKNIPVDRYAESYWSAFRLAGWVHGWEDGINAFVDEIESPSPVDEEESPFYRLTKGDQKLIDQYEDIKTTTASIIREAQCVRFIKDYVAENNLMQKMVVAVESNIIGAQTYENLKEVCQAYFDKNGYGTDNSNQFFEAAKAVCLSGYHPRLRTMDKLIATFAEIEENYKKTQEELKNKKKK